MRYVRELSQRNNLPITTSNENMSATFAPDPTVRTICQKHIPSPNNAQVIYAQEICPCGFSREICPSDLCPTSMSGLPWSGNMSTVIMFVAHANWPMCSALCPPPMAMEYVHTIYERCMATCGGYVPCTFLMRMAVVDIATRVYSKSNRHNRGTLS